MPTSSDAPPSPTPPTLLPQLPLTLTEEPTNPNAQSAQVPRFTPTSPSSTSELPSLTVKLLESVRQFPDFPTKGILFEDILPLFADAQLHQDLIRALELHVKESFGGDWKPDVVVGLEARGFLFGPSLALKLGAGFVPVRKKGKLPGPTITAAYEKEYGEDYFQIQSDGIKPGQRVLVVDDIIATGEKRFKVLFYKVRRLIRPVGGSAAAAGSLVKQLGGELTGYVFMLELDFLKGREKLDAPVYTLLSSQKDGPSKES
ncbi:MAG: adenine phosphoribosyltransferase [Icmadophila ericetorum]|nr:adenine phosphoribosyltransferase [Icmadophila ericetorum]